MSSKPNIVIIMTDEQRGDFLKSNGFALDTMPFVDSFAERGASFPKCYTPMPVCLPARCAMFTGRFPKALRVRENGGAGNIFYTKDMVEVLRDAGYSINLTGKNHSHLEEKDFDFVRFYGHSGGNPKLKKSGEEQKFDGLLKSLRMEMKAEPTPFPVECQLPYRIVRDAIECIENRDRRPFFLWLSFPEPHNPYQVCEPYFSLFPEESVPDRFAGPEIVDRKGFQWRWFRDLYESKIPGYDALWRRYRATYCGMIRLLDDQIKRFIGCLEQNGLLDDTLVVFTSDHGDYVGDYGLRRKGIGVPECLVRIPFAIAGPGIEAGARFQEEFISLVDVLPTICEALDLELPDGVQGRSLWPLLSGEAYPAAEFRSIYGEMGIGGMYYTLEDDPPLHFPTEGLAIDSLNCFSQSGNRKFVRKGKWKLDFDMLGSNHLYDVVSDPGELEDLSGDPGHAEVKREMLEELLKWTIRTEDDLPHGSYVQKKAKRNWYAPHAEGAG